MKTTRGAFTQIIITSQKLPSRLQATSSIYFLPRASRWESVSVIVLADKEFRFRAGFDTLSARLDDVFWLPRGIRRRVFSRQKLACDGRHLEQLRALMCHKVMMFQSTCFSSAARWQHLVNNVAARVDLCSSQRHNNTETPGKRMYS